MDLYIEPCNTKIAKSTLNLIDFVLGFAAIIPKTWETTQDAWKNTWEERSSHDWFAKDTVIRFETVFAMAEKFVSQVAATLDLTATCEIDKDTRSYKSTADSKVGCASGIIMVASQVMRFVATLMDQVVRCQQYWNSYWEKDLSKESFGVAEVLAARSYTDRAIKTANWADKFANQDPLADVTKAVVTLEKAKDAYEKLGPEVERLKADVIFLSSTKREKEDFEKEAHELTAKLKEEFTAGENVILEETKLINRRK